MKDNPLKTSLIGEEVFKTDERIEFLGIADTAGAFIMKLVHHIPEEKRSVKEELVGIVKKMSRIMGLVAGVKGIFEKENTDELILLTEKYRLPETKREFVLPGNTALSAEIHIVRTLARSCERAYARVYRKYGGDEAICDYLNHLSSFFFVLALFFEK